MADAELARREVAAVNRAISNTARLIAFRTRTFTEILSILDVELVYALYPLRER